MLLIAQSIERLVVAQEVTSLSLVEEPILLRLPPEASGSLSAAVPLPHDKGFSLLSQRADVSEKKRRATLNSGAPSRKPAFSGLETRPEDAGFFCFLSRNPPSPSSIPFRKQRKGGGEGGEMSRCAKEVVIMPEGNRRVAVIAIWIEARESVVEVNRLLSGYQELVRGRMGLPFRDFSASLISLILEGTTDQMGALSGKLGMLPGVTAKILFLTRQPPKKETRPTAPGGEA